MWPAIASLNVRAFCIACGPAMIAVGLMKMASVKRIDFDGVTEWAPLSPPS
jgi:xanthine/uracil/vitamin C permease (AzgA family)